MGSLIGADPEYLVRVQGEGTIVPSVGLLGGSKFNPKIVQGGAILEDNVTAEINVQPAALEDADAFVNNISVVRRQLDEVLAEHGLESCVTASAEYSPYMLDSQGAKESGCDPDMNVYTLQQNQYPDIRESLVRCAGGHIHFGDDELFSVPGSREEFIKLCDFYVGAPLAILDPDTERKKTYGAAGNFRYKDYGVEYRTPSNIWLSSPALIKFVVQQMRKAKAALQREAHDYPIKIAEKVIQGNLCKVSNSDLAQYLDVDTRLAIQALGGDI